MFQPEISGLDHTCLRPSIGALGSRRRPPKRRLPAVAVLVAIGVVLSGAVSASAEPHRASSVRHQHTAAENERADRLFQKYALNPNPDEATPPLTEALNLYLADGNTRGQANCRIFLGNLARQQRAFGASKDHFRIARSLLGELGDPLGVWLVGIGLGMTLSRSGEYEAADIEFQDALNVLDGLANLSGPVPLDSFRIFADLSTLPIPFDALEQMLRRDGGGLQELFKPALLRALDGLTRVARGESMAAGGSYKAAEAELSKALKDSGALLGVFDRLVLERIGDLRSAQGFLEEAKQAYSKALARPLFGFQPPGSEYSLHEKLSETELLLGHHQAALAANKTARAMARQNRDEEKESLLLTDQAQIYVAMNQFDQARACLDVARALARKARSLHAEAVALADIGSLGMVTGRYEEAAVNLQEAVRLYAEDRDPWGQTSAMLILGEVHGLLGRNDTFSRHMADSLRLAKAIGFREAEALATLATALDQLRHSAGEPGLGPVDAAKAIEFLRKELEASDNATLRQLVSIGIPFESLLQLLSTDSSDTAQAQELLARTHGAKPPLWEAFPLVAAGGTLFRNGMNEKAAEAFGRTRELFQESGQKDLEALSLFAMGVALWNAGSREQGSKTCREAVDLLEASVVSDLKIDDLLASFLGTGRRGLYDLLVGMLAVGGQPELAFHYSEKARARALLSALANQRLEVKTGADPKLVSQAETLRLKISRWTNEAGRNRALAESLKRAKKDYEELLTRVKISNPEYFSLTTAEAVSLKEVQERLKADQSTLVSYFVGESRVLAWVIDRDHFTQVELPVTRAELVQEVGDLFRPSSHCGARSRGAETIECRDLPDRSESLFRKVIQPLLPAIQSKAQTLILVPHGDLHYIPFAALRDPATGHLLVEDYVLSYSPSVTALKYLGRAVDAGGDQILVLGNPRGDLPGAESEARSVSRVFGVEAKLGPQATEKLVRSSVGRARLLHLATHAVYDDKRPLFSGILLAPELETASSDALARGEGDGLLEVHEIFSELNLTGVRLVTLSGCQTGAGQPTGGDDIVGLTQAFLHAGSHAVLSTLWPIDDAVSAELIVRFYQLFRSGSTAAEALRLAQLKTCREHPEPYYWAAFKLNGDPAATWDDKAGGNPRGPKP